MCQQQASNNHSPIEVLRVFLQLGLTSFGGPIAHIGYFRKAFVEQRQWLSEAQFSQLLAICQFLPGPASSQLGFAIGLIRAGWLGAMAAFFAFTLPSALLLILFASSLSYIDSPLAISALHGLKLVALAVVADAVIGMAKSLCPDWTRRLIAILTATVLIGFANANLQFLLIMAAAVLGYWLCQPNAVNTQAAIPVFITKTQSWVFLAVFNGLLLLLNIGVNSEQATPMAIAAAFFNAGAMVFGGGHVVLPLLEGSILSNGWLSEQAFISGYGAAQAIPGPMFAFAAFLGTEINNGLPLWLNASIALLFIFLPGFLLLLLALPSWQLIAGKPGVQQAIAGINAAVVGLLAAALYDPIFTSAINSWPELLIAIIGLGLIRLSPLPILGVIAYFMASSILLGHL